MTRPVVDPQRLAEEAAADAGVLRELAQNGDVATAVRSVDLHFKGSQERIEALADDAEELGFTFVGFGEYEDGDWALDVKRNSTTLPEAIAELTRTALEIELTHGVEFDGWGCPATTGRN